MHHQIEKLYQIASKSSRLIIGLMSGTSLDGLDIALCEVKGSGKQTQIKVLEFETHPYNEGVKGKIKQVFSKEQVSLEYLTLLNPWLGKLYGKMILKSLDKWGKQASDIDLIASHGQTIFHCPHHQHNFEDFANGTLQIADADHIAVTTGIITVSDFRQKHIAAGGEGAPLAQYGDYFCFSSNTENRILLNLGGIANLTWLQKGTGFEQVMCSDLGPSNTLMDNLASTEFGLPYDEQGKIAASGQVHTQLLEELLSTPFIRLPLPKSTGPEVFNTALLEQAKRQAKAQNISNEDLMATLCRFSATSVAMQINQLVGDKSCCIYASGGGIHNPELIEQIRSRLNGSIELKDMAELGISADAKEAVLFAILANETVAGDSEQKQLSNRNSPHVTMGKISLSS